MMRTFSFPCALRNKAAMKLIPQPHYPRTASSRSTNMHLHLLASFIVAAASSASADTAAASQMPPSSPSPKPKRPSSNPNPNPALCKHSPSATLDVLILVLVLFSGSFLLTSYFTYIFHSLSLLLPSLLVSHSASLRDSPLPYILGFLISFTVLIISVEICCGFRSRKCGNPMCKGLKKAMEFDLQLQTDDCVKSGSKDIDRLPWKGGSEGNPDYECLRAELRKMAPPNGRAVLLFRARCGCPIAKLEGWGPKRGRRHKK